MKNKILELTKIFLKDYYYNVFDKKNNKINKKNIFFWLIVIYGMCITYISYEGIIFSIKVGIPELFLKIFMPLIYMVIIIQLISLVCNVFYHSKDLQSILPLPIKPIEIVMSKFNTIIAIIYFMELIFLTIPMILYGILVAKTIMFFIFMIISMLLLPIFFTIIISIAMLFIMKLSRFIKNKDMFQILIVTVITFIIYSVIVGQVNQIILEKMNNEIPMIEIINYKVEQINTKIIMLNPIIKILTTNSIKEALINLLKIVLINSIVMLIFLYIANKLYLNNIIQNMENSQKNYLKEKKQYKFKKRKKGITYLKNDIKKILKNASYFTQYIVQYFIIIAIMIFLLKAFIPMILEQIQAQNIIEETGIEYFKIQILLIVVGIMQIIFTFSNLSITAISREGRDAICMKYIPYSLYNQFNIKVIPQIVINTIAIIAILAIIKNTVTNISIIYYLIAFEIGMLFNIIHSYIMLLIDALNPNLNWTNKESIGKNNPNKLYQYITTIIIIILLNYFIKILKGVSFINSIFIINIVLITIFIIIRVLIKKNINKIFSKIY